MSHKVMTALSRPVGVGLASLMIFAVSVPTLLLGAASAGQPTNRSILMSDSNPSSVVSMKLALTPTVTQAAGEIVVEFCSDTPFQGVACAFSSSTVPSVGAVAASAPSAGTATAAAVSGGAPTHAFKLTGLTLAAGTPYNVTVNNITLPSTAGGVSFYARVYVYASGGSSSYTEAATTGTAPTIGSPVDFGGIALATAPQIQISAKVMETLSFCVYKGSCGTAPTVTLGHGTNTVLDSSVTDDNTATPIVFSVSTNAGGVYSSGVSTSITLNGDTLKLGATNPFTSAGTASAAAIAAGSGKFGLRVSPGASTSAVAPYNGAAGLYGLDTTAATSTFGSQIATVSGPVNASTSSVIYAASAATTTPAGIYTANHDLVATGAF